ncbi:MAG: cation:proton antiporter [Pirellulales bacterium]
MHGETFAKSTTRPASHLRWASAYVALLGGGVGLFLAIRAAGNGLWAESVGSTAATPAAQVNASHTFTQVLIALVAILLASRVVGWCFTKLHQPRVIGEVLAGILLGPSLLGRVWPEAMQFVLPEAAAPYLGVLAQLGVVLYMFLVGLELNVESFTARARATAAISHASIVVPIVFGAALALGLYGPFAPPGVTFTSFALFMGVAMSITAFPVLARIISDRGLDKTELGETALGAAAIGDVTAWCVLAVVIGFSQADLSRSVITVVLAAVFVAVMFGPVRVALRRWLGDGPSQGSLSQATTIAVFTGLLVSSLASDLIGIHALFGAFVFGAIIPHDSAVAREFRGKLDDLVSVLLLPAFFAYTGLRTQIGLVSGLDAWLWCAAITAVATIGKVGGTWIAARWAGHDSRTATALGILMNTRGLMELIVLDMGLQLGVISPQLFAMMVLMAIATTLGTPPLLQWVWKPNVATANGR